MKGSIMQPGDLGRTLRRLLSALVLAGIVGGAALVPALADDRNRGGGGRGGGDRGGGDRGGDYGRGEGDRGDWGRGDWGRGEGDRGDWRGRDDFYGRDWRGYRPAYGYDAPSYVETPPPIIYAPPVPSAGLNFMLNFR